MCLEEEVLSQLNQGTLAPAQLEDARRHVAICKHCLNRLAALSGSQSEILSSGSSEATDPSAYPSKPLVRGQALGRYIVVEMLGSGGMGVVYSAYDPKLDRRVALKLMRAELGSPDASLRLLREAQAIARLSHPNVIAVYDVGTADDAIFIAVELVKGGTLRQWLVAEPRTWREILQAFIEAGRGLAAVHEAGLVHRDFKADNVLVGDDGRVRVTDFGLARLTTELTPPEIPNGDQRVLGTSLTESFVVLGTLPYMAPEQLSGMVADAQSDQFSFCVALYEALYGARPFDGNSVDELLKQIERGTASQSEKKEKRASVPAWLAEAVVRGLSPKPQDRHRSMGALLSVLQADPEAARRRRLAAVGIASLVAVSLVSSSFYVRHVRPSCDQATSALTDVWDNQRQAAVRKAFLSTGKAFANDAWTQTSRKLDSYAQQWVQSRVKACHAAQQKAELPDVTALRALCLDQRLAEFRATTNLMSRTDVQVVASAVQITDGLSPLAECDDLSSLAKRIRTPSTPATLLKVQSLRSRLAEAEVQHRSGKFKEGLVTAAVAVGEARGLNYPPILADALLVQASLQSNSDAPRSAEQTCREALRIALEEGYERAAARAATWLAWVVGQQSNRHEESQLWAEQASGHIVRLGNDPLLQADLLSNQGAIDEQEAHYEKAADRLERALALQEKALGSENVAVAQTLNRIGLVLVSQSRYSEAILRFRKSLDIHSRLLGPQNPHVGKILGNLALPYQLTQQFNSAIGYLQQSLNVLQEALGSDHLWLAYPLLALGNIAASEGRYPEAVQCLQRSKAIFERAFGPQSPNAASPLDSLGVISLNQGHFEDALRYYHRELALFEKVEGLEHPILIDPLLGIASVYTEQHKYSAALRVLDRARSIAEKSVPSQPDILGSVSDRYGELWLEMGQTRRAISEFQRALALFSQRLPEGAPRIGTELARLGVSYLQQGSPKLALPLLERANQIASSAKLDMRQLALRQFALAKALLLNKRDTGRSVELAARAQRLLAQSQSARPREPETITAWLQAARKRQPDAMRQQFGHYSSTLP